MTCKAISQLKRLPRRHDRGLPLIPKGQGGKVLPALTLFGADVEKAEPDGAVPRQLLKVVQALDESGLEEEGLFRMSPDAVQIEQIRMAMDRGGRLPMGFSFAIARMLD